MDGYSGDDFIDLITIGLLDRDNNYFKVVDTMLSIASKKAESRGKLLALSKCGLANDNDTSYFTKLLTLLTLYKSSFVFTWRYPYNTSRANSRIPNNHG
jgi:hypothetical protein